MTRALPRAPTSSGALAAVVGARRSRAGDEHGGAGFDSGEGLLTKLARVNTVMVSFVCLPQKTAHAAAVIRA